MPEETATHPPQVDATYEELLGRLPECARSSFDQMVSAGASIAECAETVRRYREFWDDVPTEAKEGLDRMREAGEALNGLPDEDAGRLACVYFMVKRAGDFTEVHRQRFMQQAHLARARASTSNGSITRTRPRARGAGSPAVRGASRRSSARSGDSGSEDGESEPPQAGRLCENLDCTRGPDGGRAEVKPGADYCDGACKQSAYRDREARKDAERHFGEVAWGVACKHPHAHGQFAPGGVCFACGHSRVPPTVGWYTDGPKEHRSFVSAPAPKRKTPRLGDGSRKLVFTDEHGERKRLTTDEGVIAA